ncbi:alpha/beta hydrolase [uncultured Oxalicibacterium sp.]|uniref:alpha/beta hydrolase n=1 Tax=uncultured Oxalicibacterium sp. TaxID=1168540 RepID=UPI0025D1F447|nr:alpha/beta hydrolase [uncultured Oxalicibacterium sp.]
MKYFTHSLGLICLIALVSGGLLTACMPTGIVKSKLDVIEDSAPCKGGVDTLVVMLPGAYDTPADFVRHGFVADLRERQIAADVVMADTHVGYYSSALVVERLHQDIVMPAREKGYRHIWLVGISLGGYGSLLYSKQHGEMIDGMFLMAPFLGNRSLIAEIGKSGLARWSVGNIASADYDRALWAWIKTYSTAPTTVPPLYIGYGLEDRFAGSNRLIGDVLPPERVSTVEGGHTWQPWLALWEGFLDRDVLPRCR